MVDTIGLCVYPLRGECVYLNILLPSSPLCAHYWESQAPFRVIRAPEQCWRRLLKPRRWIAATYPSLPLHYVSLCLLPLSTSLLASHTALLPCSPSKYSRFLCIVLRLFGKKAYTSLSSVFTSRFFQFRFVKGRISKEYQNYIISWSISCDLCVLLFPL